MRSTRAAAAPVRDLLHLEAEHDSPALLRAEEAAACLHGRIERRSSTAVGERRDERRPPGAGRATRRNGRAFFARRGRRDAFEQSRPRPAGRRRARCRRSWWAWSFRERPGSSAPAPGFRLPPRAQARTRTAAGRLPACSTGATSGCCLPGVTSPSARDRDARQGLPCPRDLPWHADRAGFGLRGHRHPVRESNFV